MINLGAMEKIGRRKFARFCSFYFIALFFLSFLDISYIYATNIKGVAGNAEDYRLKGYEAQQRGDIDTAIEWYQKAAAIKPDYASPHNDLGILFETKGWLDRAEAEYQKALAIDQNYKEVHTNLALLYERKGELEKAAFHWMRRYKLGEPQDPWTQEARSRLEKIGLLDKAEKVRPVIEKREELSVEIEEPVRKHAEKKTRPEAEAKKGAEWARIGPEKKVGEGLKPSPTKSKKTLDAELQESLKLAEERLKREQSGKKHAEAKKQSEDYGESKAAYTKAKDYYNKGEYTKALDTIRVAKQNSSNNKLLLGLEDEIKFKMKEERIEDYHKEGKLRFHQKDFAGARREYEAILGMIPD